MNATTPIPRSASDRITHTRAKRADYVFMMRRCSCNRCVAAREAAVAKASESTSADAPGGSNVVTVRDQATGTDTPPANDHEKRKRSDWGNSSELDSDADSDLVRYSS